MTRSVSWSLTRWEHCSPWNGTSSDSVHKLNVKYIVHSIHHWLLTDWQPSLFEWTKKTKKSPVLSYELWSIPTKFFLPNSRVFFSISHCLSMVELRPSSSLSTGCVVSLRGDWAIFCHAGSRRVGRVRSAREKSLEILCRGWELNPGGGEDRQWAIPLSYHGWHSRSR